VSYLRLYRQSPRQVSFAVFSGVLQSIVLIPIIFLVRVSFDTFIPNRDLTGLIIVGVVMTVLYVVSGALMLWSRAAALDSTRHAIGRMRVDLVAKFQHMPRERLVSDEAAHLHNLLVYDTERVSNASAALVGVLLPSAVFSVALGLALLYMNWLLFLTVIAVVPVLTIAMRWIGRRSVQRIDEGRNAFERFSSGILFLVERADLTRSQSAEPVERARQERNIDVLGKATARMGVWSAAYTAAQETVTSVSWSLVLVIGGVAVAGGLMSVGDVLAFSVAAMMLKRSVNSLIGAVPTIMEGRSSVEALAALAAEPADVAYSGERVCALERQLNFEHVSFSYGPRPLLDGLDLRLSTGEVAVIAGPSGAGKTTLLHLVLGYYRPSAGRIAADGIAYDELDMRELRRHIGFVAQDPIVFAGTVLENLTYGATEIDEARLAEACALAGADEFIQRLRDRYDTVVGEGGALLSGGQRQRIGLARALYRRPSLLLLDEPTSQLDEQLATRLVESLRNLPWHPALLIVSHELTRVAARADAVYELRDGRLELMNDAVRAGVLSAAVA
jgi:ABC-type multidrug transport system fused ATPase/permease subunit